MSIILEMSQIKQALITLGVRGKVQITGLGLSRYEVKVNSKRFGVYDTNKNTFVD